MCLMSSMVLARFFKKQVNIYSLPIFTNEPSPYASKGVTSFSILWLNFSQVICNVLKSFGRKEFYASLISMLLHKALHKMSIESV